MGIKNFSVTLEEDYVKKAKDILEEDGGKLSPIINKLLGEWIKKKEGENGNTS